MGQWPRTQEQVDLEWEEAMAGQVMPELMLWLSPRANSWQPDQTPGCRVMFLRCLAEQCAIKAYGYKSRIIERVVELGMDQPMAPAFTQHAQPLNDNLMYHQNITIR